MYSLPTAFLAPKQRRSDTRHSQWLNGLNKSMYSRSHLFFTIIKVPFRNENTKTKNIADAFGKLSHLPQKRTKTKRVTYMIVFCGLYKLFYHWLQLIPRHRRYHHRVKQCRQFTHLFFTAIHQTLSGVEKHIYIYTWYTIIFLLTTSDIQNWKNDTFIVQSVGICEKITQ